MKAPCVIPDAEQIAWLTRILQRRIRWPIHMLSLRNGHWWACIVTGHTSPSNNDWYKVTDLLRTTQP